jgi:hypothetical protein
VVKDAEERGLIKPGGTIVEGTAGNTGIGLAHVCEFSGLTFSRRSGKLRTGRSKGYKCVIFMPNVSMVAAFGVSLNVKTDPITRKDRPFKDAGRRSLPSGGCFIRRSSELQPSFVRSFKKTQANSSNRSETVRRKAPERSLDEPVRQPSKSACPHRDDRTRDSSPAQWQDRRLYLRDRDGRNASWHYSRPQRHQSQNQGVPRRSAWLRFELLCAIWWQVERTVGQQYHGGNWTGSSDGQLEVGDQADGRLNDDTGCGESRHGLSNVGPRRFIPWSKLGPQCGGCSKDGQEAWSWLQRRHYPLRCSLQVRLSVLARFHASLLSRYQTRLFSRKWLEAKGLVDAVPPELTKYIVLP